MARKKKIRSTKKHGEPFTYDNCEVTRFIDGDTFDCRISQGFHTYTIKRIRLFNCDAWESRTRDKEEKVKGLAAKARTKELLNGQLFRLKSHGLGKFGRCLGEVFVQKNNKWFSIAEILISEGHAYPYMGGNKKLARKKASKKKS